MSYALRKGREEGLEEGRAEGEQRAKREIARELLKTLDLDQVCQVTGLPVEIVQALGDQTE